MHRSSESIAAIATALAKAQTALVNPEKTMTATIREAGRGQVDERSFRYAPLSAGLELVRKALGQHELAVLQTTSIDEAGRMVRLNTVLAHSSGEWISSDWPVCPISDINTPRRMGAALTYARRYGLFSLVGIAGEDDLDAPDLNSTSADSLEVARASSPNGKDVRVPAASAQPSNGRARTSNGAGGRSVLPRLKERPSVLPSQDSARLRDALLSDIAALSPQTAAAWAGQMLASKNRLTSEDARTVEQAFEARFATLNEDSVEGQRPGPSEVQPTAPVEAEPLTIGPTHHAAASLPAETQSGETAEISISPPPSRVLSKTVRHRNKEHLQLIRQQPCLVCGRQPSDPHHLRFAQPRALGRKVSDEFTVPLCRTHHREAHRATRETLWWLSLGIAPLQAADKLWQQSRSASARVLE